MAEITERFVDSSGGVRIAVYEEGNPDGPTLVLVHGWPDSHVVWDGVVPLLADRFRIVRYDNRGVGKTSVPKAGFGLHDGLLCRRLRRGGRRDGTRAAGTRAGARLGIGGHVGVPVPARRQRSRRVVHIGVRAQRRPPQPLHHRQPQAAVPSETVPACAEPVPVLLLHGVLLHPRGGAPRRAPFPGRGAATFARGAGRNPCGETAPLGHLQDGRRQQPEGLRRQLLPQCGFGKGRPLRRRASAAHRQHQRPIRAALRLRRHQELGAAAVAARHQGRPLVADVARADASRSRCANSSTTSKASRRAGRCCARRSVVRANTSATHWFP